MLDIHQCCVIFYWVDPKSEPFFKSTVTSANGRIPSKTFSYGLKWGVTLIQHNTGNHLSPLERRKKCRLVCWELLDTAAQDKAQFWSVVYLCKSPTRSILPSRWELSSVVWDDQEGWEGGLRGRGYMYTYMLYNRNQHNIVKQLSSNK